MDRNELIKQAISQCEKDIADLQQQKALLVSSLKPKLVVTNGTKPKPKPSSKPATKKTAEPPTAEEIQSVFECFGQVPLTLPNFDVLIEMPKAKVRACLDELVKNGDVNQHGNRRSLCWVAKGVEFDG